MDKGIFKNVYSLHQGDPPTVNAISKDISKENEWKILLLENVEYVLNELYEGKENFSVFFNNNSEGFCFQIYGLNFGNPGKYITLDSILSFKNDIKHIVSNMLTEEEDRSTVILEFKILFPNEIPALFLEFENPHHLLCAITEITIENNIENDILCLPENTKIIKTSHTKNIAQKLDDTNQMELLMEFHGTCSKKLPHSMKKIEDGIFLEMGIDRTKLFKASKNEKIEYDA